MGYTKTTWQTGDTITSARLNKMEDGIAAAQETAEGAVLTFTDENNDGHVVVSVSPPVSVAIVIAFPASS